MQHRFVRAQQLSIAAISGFCVLIAAHTVHAQSAEAESLFVEGDKLMKAGKVAQACESFDASNRIEARAGTLIRLGECREQNHQLASAWSAYKDALTRVKDPNKRAIATAKVAELEPKLSYLTIAVPIANRVDQLTVTRNDKPFDAALWNRALPVDGGDYAIIGSAPGHRDWTRTVAVPIDSGKITVEIPKLDLASEVVTPPPRRQPVPPPDEQPAPPTATMSTRRKLAIGAGGVGALGIAAGIVFGTQAKSRQTDAHALCSDPQTPCAGADRANELISSAQSRALAANIGFGIGAAMVITAGVLWFTRAPESSTRVSIVPTVTPDDTGVVVFGRF
jgi:hypothetical protein